MPICDWRLHLVAPALVAALVEADLDLLMGGPCVRFVWGDPRVKPGWGLASGQWTQADAQKITARIAAKYPTVTVRRGHAIGGSEAPDAIEVGVGQSTTGIPVARLRYSLARTIADAGATP